MRAGCSRSTLATDANLVGATSSNRDEFASLSKLYSGDCAGFDECPSSEPLISRCFRGGNCHTVGHVSVTFACQCAVRSPCRCFDIAPQKRSILGSSGMFPSDKPENRFCDVRSRRRDGDSRFGRPVESTGVDRDGGDDDDSVASTGTRGRLRGFY
ncbi:hypothetical protein LSAT2_022271 [Lamellibrachia satsuma]|nr:hypothetical protein LSAT2_022271 [Lamellibrachia satsuma]